MAFRIGVVFVSGEAFFVSMLLFGCRLSINGLSIGLNALLIVKGDFGSI